MEDNILKGQINVLDMGFRAFKRFDRRKNSLFLIQAGSGRE
jgi:hypothetical protein